MDSRLRMAVLLIALGLVLTTGLGYYFGTITSSSGTSGASSPYELTLVITTNNLFNSSVGDQPAFFVLGPNGLQSSASISLPANSLIQVVIVNYDSGNATPSSPEYYNVSGTVNGMMSLVNNTVVNSTQTSSGIVISGSQTVSSLPVDLISHTFTVPQLNLNLPVPANGTVIAEFKTGAAGNYMWDCTSPCGSGPEGNQGAMATPGWMTGTLVVS
jgi:hypothetical protein